MELNQWITKVYNQVELCQYNADSKDRIIRDALIVGCNSTQVKDKIIRKGEGVELKTVVEILQTEDTTTRTIQNINSTTTTTANVHYVKYDKKKKFGVKNYNSTAEKKCFKCGYSFEKEHLKSCPAKDAECRFCGFIRHFARCCGKTGKFSRENKNSDSTPQKEDSVAKKNLHAVQAVQENSHPFMEFLDEDGNLKVQEEK